MKKLLILLLILSVGMIPLCAKTIQVGGKNGIANIQDAIDSAENGDNIVIAQGLYETTEILTVTGKKNITIKGLGMVDIICRNYVHVMAFVDCQKVTIENLHLVHSNRARSTDCEGAEVLRFIECDQITVKKCELNGCGLKGIYAIDTPTLSVIDNYIHSNVMSGIEYEIINLKLPKGILTITGNRILNNMTPIIWRNNVVYEDSNENQFLRMTNNVIYPGPPLDF